MTTTELVSKIRKESKEVKSSFGGTKSYRAICDFIMNNDVDYKEDWSSATRLKSSEIAKKVEQNFSSEQINNAKTVYGQ